MTLKCLGCLKEFKHARGLSNHTVPCKKHHELTQKGLRAQEVKHQKKKAERKEKKRCCEEIREANTDLVEGVNHDLIELQELGQDAGEGMPIEPAPGSEDAHPAVSTRSGRRLRVPRGLADYIPQPFHGIPAHIPRPMRLQRRRKGAADPVDASQLEEDRAADITPMTVEDVPDIDAADLAIKTELNTFGLYRVYAVKPQKDPEDETTLDTLCDSPTLATAPETTARGRSPLHHLRQTFADTLQHTRDNFFTPFLNATTYRLINWMYRPSDTKSIEEMDSLVHDRLDKHSQTSDAFSADDVWVKGTVKIHLPKEHTRFKSEADAPEFEVSGIYYRRLLEVIKATYQDTAARTFHWIPFKLFWRPHYDSSEDSDSDDSDDDAGDIRVYTELYNSDAFLEKDAHIRSQLRELNEDPNIEIAIVPIMLWSDSTHLASFGSAALWPIYAYFGSLSKYVRGKPSSFATHHLAYLPMLPDTIQDFYRETFGIAATTAVLKYCKRELMQAIWLLLLDLEFIHAYEHGILIHCGDGILRRPIPLTTQRKFCSHA
ncbi:hypothetical protein SCP_0406130 [Sparassis crispa]|uniref:Uncharacterized protein n=1 Tax=Sparassis crispa TaxID=139825 RepID=A0A401GJ42_9APHY|nr:hypothetical protein SCP_0406130 [Sparassis crispa]GBE82230.1 hypothetical protein SCP_0406130 [Sparassis crispa]